MKISFAEITLRGYKRFISPALPASCRFVPTCSEYAAEALTRYGWVRGCALALWRLLRCHPLARGGHDPVPVHDCGSSTKNELRGKLTTA
jgi:putative membrane protein insertion efficiency factor